MWRDTDSNTSAVSFFAPSLVEDDAQRGGATLPTLPPCPTNQPIPSNQRRGRTFRLAYGELREIVPGSEAESSSTCANAGSTTPGDPDTDDIIVVEEEIEEEEEAMHTRMGSVESANEQTGVGIDEQELAECRAKRKREWNTIMAIKRNMELERMERNFERIEMRERATGSREFDGREREGMD